MDYEKNKNNQQDKENEENLKLKIIIDDFPPSNNVFVGNQRSYRYYGKEKKKWEKMVLSSLPRKLPKKPLEKVKVNIHYIFPDKRRRDLDNFSGKFLLDPLVHKKIIKDDCYQILTNLNLSAEHIPKIRKTIIEVIGIE